VPLETRPRQGRRRSPDQILRGASVRRMMLAV
jgi:hypothetical protein